MAEYLLPFLLSFGLTALATPVLRDFLLARNIAVPPPRPRDLHARRLPRMGGLAIVASFSVVVGLYLVFAPDSLRFVESTISGIDRNLLGVLLGALILVATGYWDDRYGLSPLVKLGLQVIAALVVVAFGIRIWWITDPLGGPNISIGEWSWVLIPLWLVAMVNVMNWFDGLDGLTSGLSGIAATAIFFLALSPVVDQPATALLAAIVAGAAFGFLPYNWHPSSIILGDTGSMFLGFMVGVFAIISGAKFATAALVLGIPLLDFLWVVTRRLVTGQSLFQADTKHLHHRFLAAGLSPRATVSVLYIVATAFALIALNTQTEGKLAALGALVALMVLLGIVLVVSAKRRVP
ncbi:undecaprenyl/decaprenyl-phosphate alpha-N-acetylglucosaminyl 1-phosphate transferase [Candidatus Berkelbacteria bacterium]|nr:undecaprenyl/decaprenyl-phosphate alpha-N-acetylglucosaminyl 1-phosphate transferase [Candidatus Berkelbacteria bacterium]